MEGDLVRPELVRNGVEHADDRSLRSGAVHVVGTEPSGIPSKDRIFKVEESAALLTSTSQRPKRWSMDAMDVHGDDHHAFSREIWGVGTPDPVGRTEEGDDPAG